MIRAILVTSLLCRLTATRKLVPLRGAGASFPSPVYARWLTAYKTHRQEFVDINSSYSAVGSGQGIGWLLEGTEPLEYAGSDLELTPEQAGERPDLHLFPVIAGAVAVSFNIPGVVSVNLTKDHLVGIYNGSLAYWDDIQAWNPSTVLPHKSIIVIARADKSGTTEIFTSALSVFNSEWRAARGRFSEGLNSSRQAQYWDPDVVALYGRGNRGMSGLLLSIVYSVGYISIADAKEAGLPHAMLLTENDHLVGPTLENVQTAMDTVATSHKGFTKGIKLVETRNETAYPIAGFSYLIFSYAGTVPCDSAIELFRFLEWSMTTQSAIRDCVSLGFVPVSEALAGRVLAHIKANYLCRGGHLVSDLVAEQIAEETRVDPTTRLVLISLGVCCVVIFCLLAAYIVWVQVRKNAALLKKKWKIPYDVFKPLQGRMAHSVCISMLSFNSSKQHCNSIVPTFQGKILMFHENLAWLQPTHRVALEKLKLSTKRYLLQSQTLQHQNIGTFYGLTMAENRLYFAMEYELNGLLHDVLHGGRYDLDDNFKFCLSIDVANGTIFLHSRGIVCGTLSSSNCIIDSKWNVKIANWLHCSVSERENNTQVQNMPSAEQVEAESSYAQSLLTQAPELLTGTAIIPNKLTDVYSFAMLVVEIFSQCEPFEDALSISTTEDVIQEITKHNLRPILPTSSSILQKLLKQCWSTEPTDRPNFMRVHNVLKHARPSRKGLLDCMMDAMKSYVERLEDMVKERTHELTEATDSMRTLLYQILPPRVAEKLQKGEAIDPENYDSVTVFFSDIVGFTTLSALSTPMQIVHFLNSLYSCFDVILDKHDVYKVETIGDAYMVISGLPERNGIQHAASIADMALELMTAAWTFTIPHLPDEQLQLRAGIHSGPVAAGVVGVKMPRFCLFGDTVNTASRMESSSVAMKIQVSEDFREIAKKLGGYDMLRRGTVSVKGKGDMVTYWLLRKNANSNATKC